MKIILCLLLYFTVFICHAQERYYEKPAKYITRFPFKQLSGGVILVEARFNDLIQPFHFILDTGSGAISLDSSTVVEFNITHVTSVRSVSLIAGIR
jgi:hypothetical protein